MRANNAIGCLRGLLFALLAVVFFSFFSSAPLAYCGEAPQPLYESEVNRQLDRLKSGSVAEKVAALERLSFPSPLDLAKKYLPKIRAAAKTEEFAQEPELLRQLCRTLGRITFHDQPEHALDEQLVTAGLTHENPAVRRSCALALGKIFAGTKRSFPAMPPLLNDNEPQVRYRAAEALARIGGESNQALATQTMVRLLGVKVDLEPEEQEILPQAYRAAREMWSRADGNEAIFVAEIEKDGRIDDVIAQVKQTLAHHYPFVRQTSAKILGVLGEHSRGAAAQLVKGLEAEREPTVEIEMLTALPRLQPPAEAYLKKAIIGKMNSASPQVRAAAVQAIGEMNLVEPELLQPLIAALDDAYEPASVYAAWAISKFKDKGGPAVPKLITQLKRKNVSPQHTAYMLRALQAIGSKEAFKAIDEFKIEYEKAAKSAG